MVNPRTGETVEVLSETPELLVLQATWPAGGPRAVPHVHPAMQERWEVLEGTAVIDVDGRRHQLAVGDSVVAEPGQPHLAANAGDVPTVVRIEMRPALRWVDFVRRLFAGESAAVLLPEFPAEIAVPGRR